MKKDLAKQWAMGKGAYPKTLQESLKLMTLYQEKGIIEMTGGSGKNGGTVEGGAAFTQTGGPVNGPDAGVKCFSCGGPHYASRCPKTTQEQKDELYSAEAKAKQNELQIKNGVNQLTTDGKVETKPAQPAKAEGKPASASAVALCGFSADRNKQALELLNVLESEGVLDEDGVCSALVASFPEQMAGVSLFAKCLSGNLSLSRIRAETQQ